MYRLVKVFFALGARISGDEERDSAELARIVRRSWSASKQQCNVLITALGYGTCENVTSGGEWECVQKTLQGGCVHHWSAKLWVVNSTISCDHWDRLGS